MALQRGIIRSLSDLPHGREMQDYLIDLAVALTGKKKPLSDFFPNLQRKSAVFVDGRDMEAILKQVRHIYQTKGYCAPWDLENDLIRHYHPNIPETAIAVADIYTAAELGFDHLTGYHHKTQVPLVMGFSALYVQTIGSPVSVLEIDYSNMRGTNEHFARVIAASEGKSPDSVQYDAMQMTDYMSYTLAKKILTTLQEDQSIPDDVHFIPLRTGGDEVRIVMANMPIEDAQRVVPDIHAAIEKMTARAGLHNHPHSKRPQDPVSRGFGACGAAFELKAEGHHQYSETIRLADRSIQNTKTEIGTQRLNNPAFDKMRPASSKSPDLYSDQHIAADYYTHVMTVMSEMHEHTVTLDIDANRPPTLEAIAEKLQPQNFLTLKQIQTHFQAHLSDGLQQRGIALTKAEEKALEIKSTRFPSLEYGSGTLIGRDFPAMVGAALQVVNNINKKTGRTDSLWTFGVNFHNLSGLNDALGHEFANTILRHQARHIIEESFATAGIAPENIVLSHTGGGEFRAVIQPYIQRPDGTAIVVDDAAMAKVKKEIEDRTQILNAKNIKKFAQSNSIPLESKNFPKTFGDILNSRAERRPHENGIVATVCACAYQEPAYRKQAGGAISAFIGDAIEQAVLDRRNPLRVPAANPAMKCTPTL